MVNYITYLQINDKSNSQNKLDTYNTWYIVFTYLYTYHRLVEYVRINEVDT